MRIGAIDIGTNTILLLIADVSGGRIEKIARHEQRLPRIGKDVDARKRIQPSAMERAAVVLGEYAEIARELMCDRVVACATSAVRDATNRQEFTAQMKAKSGIDIEILSGEEEARLTYVGAMSGFDGHGGATVIDIGGGSTEITRGDMSGRIVRKASLQVGSVRITERFLKHDPPTERELGDARKFVDDELSRAEIDGGGILVGVAGTVTTLACLDQQLETFEVEKVAGYRMSRDTIVSWFSTLASKSSDEILRLSRTTQGRADILTAGVLILDRFMSLMDFEEIVTSERGLRYGLVLREE